MKNKPFYAFKSNSWKIDGILKDYNLSDRLLNSDKDLFNLNLNYEKPNINIDLIKRNIDNMFEKCFSNN
jgi:hypothetical protein